MVVVVVGRIWWTKGLLVQPFDPDELRADSAVQVSSCCLNIYTVVDARVRALPLPWQAGSRGEQGKAVHTTPSVSVSTPLTF